MPVLTKLDADGSRIEIRGAIVTAVFPGFFRIGSDPGVKCVVPDGVSLPAVGNYVA